jgi:hypothetical protein
MRMPKKASHRRKVENGDKPLEPYKEIFGYYHSLSMACSDLLDCILRGSEAESVQEFAQELKRARDKILRMVDVFSR